MEVSTIDRPTGLTILPPKTQWVDTEVAAVHRLEHFYSEPEQHIMVMPSRDEEPNYSHSHPSGADEFTGMGDARAGVRMKELPGGKPDKQDEILDNHSSCGSGGGGCDSAFQDAIQSSATNKGPDSRCRLDHSLG